MAFFTANTRADYLSALGDTATVGSSSLLVDLVDDADEIEVGGQIVSNRPYALAEPGDLAEAGVLVGSVLVVNGRSWLVQAIETDEAGFALLWLGVA